MIAYEKRGKLAQVERRMAEKGFFKYLFLRLRQFLDAIVAKIVRRIISMKTKVEDNKIIFMHYSNQYQCNPAYICDELIRQNIDCDIVFAADKKTINLLPSPFPEQVRLVRRNSLEFFYEAASAKIWIDNAVCFPWEYVPKKKNQIYINTWHGSMGLKRIDSNKIVVKKWARAAKIASKITNYMISNSAFETEVYRTTYWPDEKVKILEYGHPRNDILFANDEEKKRIKKKVCDFYNIDENCRLILYAPTFRDEKTLSCYDIDYNGVLEAAKERFGGEWKILNRYHFKVANALKNVKAISGNPDILQGNIYPDIQELMVASDIGITDYSSWICDFVLTRKPGFIYANDLKKYDKERGFYYPLDSTPFPISENNGQLIDSIKNFDSAIYDVKVKEFLDARGCKENGTASKQVVELIKTYINPSENK